MQYKFAQKTAKYNWCKNKGMYVNKPRGGNNRDHFKINFLHEQNYI